MRQATIDFCLREQEEEDQRSNSASFLQGRNATATSTPNSDSSISAWPNWSSSFAPSPDSMGCSSSRQSDICQIGQSPNRKLDPEASTHKVHNGAGGGKPSEMAMMMQTFKLPKDELNVRGRTKKPKTEQELFEHRFRRLFGTCDKQKKRKRKCPLDCPFWKE